MNKDISKFPFRPSCACICHTDGDEDCKDCCHTAPKDTSLLDPDWEGYGTIKFKATSEAAFIEEKVKEFEEKLIGKQWSDDVKRDLYESILPKYRDVNCIMCGHPMNKNTHIQMVEDWFRKTAAELIQYGRLDEVFPSYRKAFYEGKSEGREGMKKEILAALPEAHSDLNLHSMLNEIRTQIENL